VSTPESLTGERREAHSKTSDDGLELHAATASGEEEEEEEEEEEARKARKSGARCDLARDQDCRRAIEPHARRCTRMGTAKV